MDAMNDYGLARRLNCSNDYCQSEVSPEGPED